MRHLMANLCINLDFSFPSPTRFAMVAALLGCHILTVSDLTEFHLKLVPELKQAQEGKYKVGFERVIRAVVNYIRALPSIEDHDIIANDVFGNEKDPRVKKLKESVKYFHKGIFIISDCIEMKKLHNPILGGT